jgi:hypothetical protein
MEDDILYNHTNFDNMEQLKLGVPFKGRHEVHVLTLIALI